MVLLTVCFGVVDLDAAQGAFSRIYSRIAQFSLPAVLIAGGYGYYQNQSLRNQVEGLKQKNLNLFSIALEKIKDPKALESWSNEIVIPTPNGNISAGIVTNPELSNIFNKICQEMGIFQSIPIYWENSPFLEKRGTIAGVSVSQQHLLLSNLFDYTEHPDRIFTLYHEAQHLQDMKMGLFKIQSPQESEKRAEMAACQHINCPHCLQAVADSNRRLYKNDESVYAQGYLRPEQIEVVIQEKKINGTSVICLGHHKLLFLGQNGAEIPMIDFLPEVAKN